MESLVSRGSGARRRHPARAASIPSRTSPIPPLLPPRVLLILASLAATAAIAQAAAPGRPTPLAERLGVTRHGVQELALEPRTRDEVEIPLELDGRRVTLRLARASLRAPGFRLLVQTPEGHLEPVEAPPPHTWRGRIVERPGSLAAGSIRDGALSALIALPDGRVVCVQPLHEIDPAAARALHVVYAAADAIAGAESCTVDEAQAPVSARPQSGAGTAELRFADLAIDADHEFFLANGGSVGGTVDDIETLINAVNVVYQRDCELIHRLSTVIVRSTEPDPYASTSPDPLLDELRDHWNAVQSGVDRDLVHLMTGKDLEGGTIGYAAVGVVCNRSRAYGLSQARYTTNLGRRTALVAHELGHNWNAVHCNSEDPCHIMCSSINGCDGIGLPNFEPAGIQDILSFAASRSCLDAPPLAVGDVAPAATIRLAAPQPSPFEGQTRLSYHVDGPGRVRLAIYDVAGHRVALLADGAEAPGWHTRIWDGRDTAGLRLAPGVFYARLEAGGATASAKLVMVR